MWDRLRWWWAARTSEPELTDGELERTTREVSKAIVQTLSNRTFRRPELETSDPRGSSERQRSFDRETVDGFHESIAPTIRTLRREYLARGQWSPELERLATEPTRPADLRDLVIALGERVGDD